MSARLARIDFDQLAEFDLEPRVPRQQVEERFAELKDNLLDELLAQTEVVGLEPRFALAANEAAGLAWATEYPLLVFPELLDELAVRERKRNLRQQQIIAETEALLEAAV
jgi:hypothetical protein